LVVKPLIFKRILTTNDEFWTWRDLVANGHLTEARRDCSIQMYLRDYTVAFTWEIKNAWPASVEIEPLGTMIPGEAPGKKALMEIVTIIHEGLARSGHTSYTQALGSILAA
jgi:phage tail-like protein